MDIQKKSKNKQNQLKQIYNFLRVLSKFSMRLQFFSAFFGNLAGDVFAGFLKSALNF